MNNFESQLVAWSIAWEGSISLHYDKKSKSSLQTKIWIGNTERELLDNFLQLVKVGRVRHNRNATKNHKACWEWQATSQAECRQILESVLSYLPSSRKGQIAKLVLEFIKTRKEANCVKYNAPYSKREWEIFAEVRLLNRRGYRIINDNKEVKVNVNP